MTLDGATPIRVKIKEIVPEFSFSEESKTLLIKKHLQTLTRKKLPATSICFSCFRSLSSKHALVSRKVASAFVSHFGLSSVILGLPS
jgi:hypothetical protein